MAETAAGQAKLDKMIASGMGRQQALSILINAQKKEQAAAAASSTTSQSASSGSSSAPTPTKPSFTEQATAAGWTIDDESGGWKPPADSGGWQWNAETGLKQLTPTPSVPTASGGSTGGGSGGGSSGSSSESVGASSAPVKIKAATPDLLILGEQDILADALMERLIFEDIGGQELLLVTRHDLINGQNIIYQPITNLPDISLRYNSKNIVALPQSSEEVFQQFSIKLEQHVPSAEDIDNENVVNISSSGDLVVNCLDPNEDYLVEIEILSAGTTFSDTIY